MKHCKEINKMLKILPMDSVSQGTVILYHMCVGAQLEDGPQLGENQLDIPTESTHRKCVKGAKCNLMSFFVELSNYEQSALFFALCLIV